jgi:hypothetical protein
MKETIFRQPAANADSPNLAATRSLADRGFRLGWLIPPASVVLAAWRLRQNGLPTGHDSLAHVGNAAALSFLLRHDPRAAWLFVRTNFFHWPPLVHFVTALLLAIAPGAWAYHVTTLLFDALFVLFVSLLALRVAPRAESALLATLAVVACPQWTLVASAYNLECAAAFAVVFAAWALASGRHERSAAASLAWGFAGGVALLAKPVAVVPAAGLAAWDIVRRWRDRRPFGGAGLFFAALFGPSLTWCWLQFVHISPEWRYDVTGAADLYRQPWAVYARAFRFESGIAPFLLLLAGVGWLVPWRRLPPALGLLCAGAAAGFGFFSCAATKNPIYVLASFTLLLVAAAAAVGAVDRPAVRTAQRAAIVVYAVLAVLVWAPGQARAVRILSLGSAEPLIRAVPPVWRTVAEDVAHDLSRLAEGREACPITWLDATGRGPLDLVRFLLPMRDPRFALARGKLWMDVTGGLPRDDPRLAPDRGFTRDFAETIGLVPQSCFLAAVVRRTPNDSGAPTLLTDRPLPNSLIDAELRRVMEEAQTTWTRAARLPAATPEATIVIYQNDAALRAVPPAASPADVVAQRFLDHPNRVVNECLLLLRAGRFRDAGERARALRRQHSFDNEVQLDIAVWSIELAALPHFATPAEEAARLLEMVPLVPASYDLMARIVNRLGELTRAGAAAPPAVWGAAASRRFDAGDPPWQRLARPIFVCLLDYGPAGAAAAWAQRELDRMPDGARAAALWMFAETAEQRGAAAIAAEFYGRAAARVDLPPAQAAEARKKLADSPNRVMRECLRLLTLPHVAPPEDEAARLVQFIPMVPASIELLERMITRLGELGRAGAAVSPAEWGDAAVGKFAPDDPNRRRAAQAVLGAYLDRGPAAAAADWAQRELDQAAEGERAAVCWGFAETAARHGAASLAARFYDLALARADLPPARRLVGQIRLAALVPGRQPPEFAAADVPEGLRDPEQVGEVARVLVTRSQALRASDRVPEALEMWKGELPWLASCPVCGEEITLEVARCFLQIGETASAVRELAEIHIDPNLRKIAADLIAAAK